ncbi:MAG TPA: tRNA (adenosine(37)-N6)-threonylcarbamoyltransferase complex transferase subunit TsaD [bacterium]|jgi:N6-L-threonylcarbamoyladenine synthase|nr:MAG: tRNA N6-adenosine threonylcarbamoyltransferase [Parcubacteria group bacterium ADurb.Bin115]HNU81738.1 tRNA (adenosine(37)-N6)-threonylcarbamoyltransferase complex transferase subunit TsaD [bacterium]HOD87302.1 tRNA (adenosine(37)-N6)-threonylcarbamoyltransferase complex transferase subunit TsaD [bacterium]HQL34886.1 tRNA (adenosine(37)-N6)-threonylcarbamoyltransferase complex transferase subunit TsaD [bacterium]HQQ38442.1 tRNA (adenosine(37)-N6)-threonylcarbamoyltransferase complex tran
MYILGIESSCDESAASVLKASGQKTEILSNVIASQINIHAQYGGVIPEIAAREHVLHILPTIDSALKQAKITHKDIKALAVTQGPGLITSLIAGVESAKALSLIWKKPLIPVHHVIGHIYANFINRPQAPKFPLLALVVSGGHSNLIYMKEHYQFKIIGETRDDAAGEAYDKAAKMMGLSYPGGPIIAKYAEEYRQSGQKSTIQLPRPMLNSPDFDFSFSGLKTALLYQLQKDKNWKKRLSEYCFAFEQAIIETLIHKTLKAANKYQPQSIVLAGGVAANSALREQLSSNIKDKLPKIAFFLPEKQYTTDNAAMIASAGYFNYYKHKNKAFLDYSRFKARCDLKI